MPSTPIHLHDELVQTQDRVVVQTRFGPITGGRSRNGAAIFLGKEIVPVLSVLDSTLSRRFRNTLRSSTW
jgi:hypothetical protein